MTSLEAYLTRLERGQELPSVDWKSEPWAAAQPMLHWLELAPAPDGRTRSPYLSAIDAQVISDRMLHRFVIEGEELAWSSHMLQTALDATAASVGGAPEPLIRSAWDLVASRALDIPCYNFCRALGRELLGAHRRGQWDLTWMLVAPSPGQACLRYWTLALKPQLWKAVERETMDILRPYSHRF